MNETLRLDLTSHLSYHYRMNKKAISVSLDPSNLMWLRAQVVSSGCRSVSEILDRLIREARTNNSEQDATTRSVVGTILIAESDPTLSTADAAIRAIFTASLDCQPATTDRKARSTKVRQRTLPREQARD